MRCDETDVRDTEIVEGVKWTGGKLSIGSGVVSIGGGGGLG